MEVTVYVDIIFAANCVVSGALTVWMGMTLSRKKSVKRMLLASILGGMGTTISFLTGQYYVHSQWKIIIKGILLFGENAVTLIGMLRILFPLEKGKAVGHLCLQFLAAVVLYAGILSVGVKGERQAIVGAAFPVVLSFKQLLVKSAVFLGTIPLYRWLYEKRQLRKKQWYPFVLEKNGRKKEGIGFLDTGNGLCHPRTREPVVVTQHAFLKEFFEPEEYHRQETLLEFGIGMENSTEKVVWIPYHSIGKDNGLLPGIYFDHLIIKDGSEQIDCPHTLVAFCKEKISAQEEYHMLLHSCLYGGKNAIKSFSAK